MKQNPFFQPFNDVHRPLWTIPPQVRYTINARSTKKIWFFFFFLSTKNLFLKLAIFLYVLDFFWTKTKILEGQNILFLFFEHWFHSNNINNRQLNFGKYLCINNVYNWVFSFGSSIVSTRKLTSTSKYHQTPTNTMHWKIHKNNFSYFLECNFWYLQHKA